MKNKTKLITLTLLLSLFLFIIYTIKELTNIDDYDIFNIDDEEF